MTNRHSARPATASGAELKEIDTTHQYAHEARSDRAALQAGHRRVLFDSLPERA